MSDQSQAVTPLTEVSPEAPYAKLSKSQLERLVAPIALYSDALIAQILAASTFPTQITDAEDWLQHPGLNDRTLLRFLRFLRNTAHRA